MRPAVLVDAFLRLRVVWLNLFFVAYFIWGRPFLFPRLLQTKGGGQVDVGLALFLVLVQFLEIAGLWFKYPLLHAGIPAEERSRIGRSVENFLKPRPASPSSPKEGGERVGGLVPVVFLLMLRLFVALLLIFAVGNALGIGYKNGADSLPLQCGVCVLGGGLFLKEVGVYALWFGKISGPDHYPHMPPLTRQALDAAGEGLLAVFAAVVYTVVWDVLVAGSPFAGTPGEYAGAALFFVFVFSPLQLMPAAYFWLVPQPRRQRVASVVFYLVSMLAAVGSLPLSG